MIPEGNINDKSKNWRGYIYNEQLRGQEIKERQKMRMNSPSMKIQV